jgi:diguanylate cyclase (GGDEF)-like protein
MSELKDPRLVEIEILSEVDQATFGGSGSYRYDHPGSRGVQENLKHEALLHLAFDGAVLLSDAYVSKSSATRITGSFVPGNAELEHAIRRTVWALMPTAHPSVNLVITQRGRLRLYRLRDEILNRDRIRDDFGILWAKRHYLPDLEVKLRFRQPTGALSIILLDVDRLKLINTTFAHAGADEVLKGIFEILRDKVQPADAYRLGGGDEAGAEDIRATVERAFADKKMDGGITPTVTLAVGTATNSVGAEDLHRRVDSHLTAKKDQGGLRNAVHFLEDAPAVK